MVGAPGKFEQSIGKDSKATAVVQAGQFVSQGEIPQTLVGFFQLDILLVELIGQQLQMLAVKLSSLRQLGSLSGVLQ